jgi:hypothetical protein
MKNKLAISALKAYPIYVIVVSTMIIVTEFSPAFKKFLEAVGGHHWTGKSILGALLFIILTIIFNTKGSGDDLGKNINRTIISAVTGSIVIFLFFAIHYNL